jgi:hypothetical protein
VGVLFCFGVGERMRCEGDGMDGVAIDFPGCDFAIVMEGRNAESKVSLSLGCEGDYS